MKTGEVAKMMGLNPKTITNWTDQTDLAVFFSTGARGLDGTLSQRDYTDEDVLVINTIRINKTRRNTWKDVAKLLAAGHRDDEFPVTATLAKSVTSADHVIMQMALRAERDTALAQLEDAYLEIDRLRQQDKNRQQEIIELHKLIARLEYRLEQDQEAQEQEDDTP